MLDNKDDLDLRNLKKFFRSFKVLREKIVITQGRLSKKTKQKVRSKSIK